MKFPSPIGGPVPSTFAGALSMKVPGTDRTALQLLAKSEKEIAMLQHDRRKRVVVMMESYTAASPIIRRDFKRYFARLSGLFGAPSEVVYLPNAHTKTFAWSWNDHFAVHISLQDFSPATPNIVLVIDAT